MINALDKWINGTCTQKSHLPCWNDRSPDLTGKNTEIYENRMSRISPPLRGGVAAALIKVGEAHRSAADGVVCVLRENVFVMDHHPVCAE